MLVSRYLVASDSVDRSGPVEAAMRVVAYTSEDGKEGSEEADSSVEEERQYEGFTEEREHVRVDMVVYGYGVT
jgi:hypothetical protein